MKWTRDWFLDRDVKINPEVPINAMEYARQRMCDPINAEDLPLRVQPLWAAYVQAYAAWKDGLGLLDFTDYLEISLRSGLKPRFKYLIVDEAQDFSPLQVSILASWQDTCEWLIIAGDDDQAIYEFQGADPKWMVDVWRALPPARRTVLPQSYRLPRKPWRLCVQVSARIPNRIPKTFKPRKEEGAVIRGGMPRLVRYLRGRPWPKDDPPMILFRTRGVLETAAEYFKAAGIPYKSERVNNHPISEPWVKRAVYAASFLFDPLYHRVNNASLPDLIVGLSKEAGAARAALGTASEPSYGKGLINDFEMEMPDGPRRPVSLRWLCKKLRIRYEGGKFPIGELITGLEPEKRALVTQAYNTLGRSCTLPGKLPILTTFHASKGRQAHTVVVCPDVTRQVAKAIAERDPSEWRTLYVAMSRCLHTLFLLDPHRDKHYIFPR